MADPEMATSHTKRVSYADYDYPTAADLKRPQTTVDFHFRRGSIKEFQMVTLPNLFSARAIMAMKLDTLSTSPTRVVLLNDDTRVDMPEVDLDELESIVEQETVLGSGHGRQIFVIAYDRDPTTAAPEEEESKVPHQGRRQTVAAKDCCVVT